MSLAYKRGLFRLWIIASVIWLVAFAITHGEAIGFYVGFHYSLFDREASWQAALEKKHRNADLSQLCKHAHDSSCVRRDEAAYNQCFRSTKDEYGCLIPICDRDAYTQNAKTLFTAAGFPADRLTAELCDGFQTIEVPYLNWTAIGVAVLPIFLPLILWLIGAWTAGLHRR